MRIDTQIPTRMRAAGSAATDISSNIDAIVGGFNTWAFKREQPSDMALLRQAVANAVMERAPVPFVLYWGKGPRIEAAGMEAQSLAYLASLGERVQRIFPSGARFDLLLTDSHARLNGYQEQDINAYFDSITKAAGRYGFTCRRLSEVTNSAQSSINHEPLERPDPQLLANLSRSAAKWYLGSDDPSVAAVRYFALNMIERRAVAQTYPDAIFITFNNSQFRPLFPRELPIFYMYSVKKGVAVKPWFMEDDIVAA